MRPNIICSRYYSGDLFMWEGNKGSCEISTLEGHEYPALCPVYNDACDEGFGVVGRTRDVIFAVDHVEIDRENDIQWWRLKSISEPGFEIILFNY